VPVLLLLGEPAYQLILGVPDLPSDAEEWDFETSADVGAGNRRRGHAEQLAGLAM
jgi:hypothetical protein